jgi:hypothetical protein
MKNLAGIMDANDEILQELIAAEIPIFATTLSFVPHPNSRTMKFGQWVPTIVMRSELDIEVPTNYYGQIDQIKFTRHWYYWGVSNLKLPLNLAWKIYNDPIGKKDVRAFGHCGCVEPTWCNHEYVDSYHVDSLEGLQLLVKTIREMTQ